MGALNGFIIVKYKFASLIVTLGTSSIFSGLLLGAFEAERMDLPDTLQRFGKASLLTVKNAKTGLGSTLPMTFLIMVVLYVAYMLSVVTRFPQREQVSRSRKFALESS